MTSNSKKSKNWIIGISIFGIIWNLLGVNAYLQQAYQTESFKAMYTPEQLETITNMPVWATTAFAIAVFAGLLGSITLLAKKKITVLIFLISLIGILVQFMYNFFVAKIMEVYGPGALIMPILIIVIGIFLVYYSKKCLDNGRLS